MKCFGHEKIVDNAGRVNKSIFLQQNFETKLQKQTFFIFIKAFWCSMKAITYRCHFNNLLIFQQSCYIKVIPILHTLPLTEVGKLIDLVLCVMIHNLPKGTIMQEAFH